jgi:hypothetical protein
MHRLFVWVPAILVTLLLCYGELYAYSVLTHMEIVDLLWTDGVRPLLLKRYPESSALARNDPTLLTESDPFRAN